MKKIHCEIHNQDIVIYEANEHHVFKDDNSRETVIFINEDGNKTIKRFVADGCNEDCLTFKKCFGKIMITQIEERL